MREIVVDELRLQGALPSEDSTDPVESATATVSDGADVTRRDT